MRLLNFIVISDSHIIFDISFLKLAFPNFDEFRYNSIGKKI